MGGAVFFIRSALPSSLSVACLSLTALFIFSFSSPKYSSMCFYQLLSPCSPSASRPVLIADSSPFSGVAPLHVVGRHASCSALRRCLIPCFTSSCSSSRVGRLLTARRRRYAGRVRLSARERQRSSVSHQRPLTKAFLLAASVPLSKETRMQSAVKSNDYETSLHSRCVPGTTSQSGLRTIGAAENRQGEPECSSDVGENNDHDDIALQRLRELFPVLSEAVYGRPLVYLDNAATSLKPKCVIHAVQKYYESYSANVHRAAHSIALKATEEFEAARDSLQRFINASHREEIVFTRSATEAVNLVAYTWGEQNIVEGDEILLSVAEHHSNLVPWQELARRKNATVKYLPLSLEEGKVDISALKSLLSNRTKLLALHLTSNVLGSTTDFSQIRSIIRGQRRDAAECARSATQLQADDGRSTPEGGNSNDVTILIDACQSLPHMHVDVQKLDCDFLVGSAHKMMGPTGIGFLFGRLELLSQMNPWQFGGEMINEVTLKGSTFQDPPYRFEAGTPHIASAIGLGEAVRFLQQDIGFEQIQRRESSLTRHLMDRLRRQLPQLTLHGPPEAADRSSIVALSHPKVHSQDIATFLDYEGVAVRAGHHCCQPLHTEALKVPSTLRASLSFYNTHQEVQKFVYALAKIVKMLEGMQNA